MKRKSPSRYGGLRGLATAASSLARGAVRNYISRIGNNKRLKTANRYRGNASNTRTAVKRKSRPMRKTDDEILGCYYSLTLGNRKLYNRKILGRTKYLLSATQVAESSFGYQQPTSLTPIGHVNDINLLEQKLPLLDATGAGNSWTADRNWYLKSAYYTAMVTNATNSPVEISFHFCMCRENVDAGEATENPAIAWNAAEAATNPGVIDANRILYWKHGPSGTLFHKFWKIKKTCRFSLGPYNTKKIGLMVWYNKLMNSLDTSGTSGSLRGTTIIPMIVVSGSPAFTATAGITLTSVKVAVVSAVNYTYYGLENRQKTTYYNDSLSHDAVNLVGNVDLGQEVPPEEL